MDTLVEKLEKVFLKPRLQNFPIELLYNIWIHQVVVQSSTGWETNRDFLFEIFPEKNTRKLIWTFEKWKFIDESRFV